MKSRNSLSLKYDLFEKGGGGSTQPTTTSNEPSSLVQPYLSEGLASAQNLYHSNAPGYYPGSTVVPFASETEQALNQMYGIANTGGSGAGAANQYWQDVIGGKYLAGQNPYLDQMWGGVSSKIRSGLDSQFSRGGRYGSGLHAQALSEGLGNAGAQLYGSAYEAERNRQQQALQMSPMASQLAYADANVLSQIGAQREGQSQAILQDEINRFYANDPYTQERNKLQDYMNFISPGLGFGTQTTTQPLYKNNNAALGGLLSAAGLIGNFALPGANAGSVGGAIAGKAMGK